MRAVLWAALATGVLVGAPACEETPPPECSAREMDEACLPAYVPTFDNVFTYTLSQSCGSDENECHGDRGSSPLSFADKVSAYEQLIDDGYVVPGNPRCSEMIVRITDIGEDYTMPRDESLEAAERCALQTWVRMGAPGPGEPLP